MPKMSRIHAKETFLFLKEWKVKKVEGSFSFPDPMVNGVLYGWSSALGLGQESRRIVLDINFCGENWCSGEVTVSPKAFFRYLLRWFPLLLGRGR